MSKDLPRDIADARVQVLTNLLRTFSDAHHSRVQAEPETKRDMRRRVGELGELALEIQGAMISGTFPHNHELFQDCNTLVDRAIGKAAQPLTGGDGGPIQTQQIPFDPRAISLEQAEAAKNAIEEAKRILGVSGK